MVLKLYSICSYKYNTIHKMNKYKSFIKYIFLLYTFIKNITTLKLNVLAF